MHTNTTGGPTDRPVLHRRPEDAADQPTTEPSAVETLAKLIDAHSVEEQYTRNGEYHSSFCYGHDARVAVETHESHHQAQAILDAGYTLAPAPQPAADKCDGSGRCTARLHVHGCFADLDGHCDDPDDHPAADTETEVQWGVRYGLYIESTYSEASARAKAKGHVHFDGGTPPVVIARTVTRTVTKTPWEEA